MNDEISLRSISGGDTNFILSTWLNHYKNHSYFTKRIKKEIFYPNHERVIKHILGKKETVVCVACLPDDPNVILGYLVCEIGSPSVIHFTFVKEPFRKMGIARKLIASLNLNLNQAQFSHWTFDVDQLIKKFPAMIYNPYRI